MSARLCQVLYTTVEDGAVLHLPCQYLAGHASERHSWFAVQQEDATRGQRGSAIAISDLPIELRRLAEQVQAGLHDTWLELLLAVLHDRKRAKRGVAGFQGR